VIAAWEDGGAMDARFHGFSAQVFEWFEGLERDNSRAYFGATRELYESEIRGGLTALLDELAADFGGTSRVFRQQRDLRFSADKTPYKTRTYGVLLGGPQAAAGLYAELSSRGLYAGSGYHRMARDQLARYRDAVVHEPTGTALAAALRAAEDAGLEVVGSSLRTGPRGYPRDHARGDLLCRTALVAGHRLPASRGIARDAALGHVAGSWRGAAPLTAWLDANVGSAA
jgi:uncharacterized protein (TIGR02453 family)